MNELVKQAREARTRSYSPYSRFAVGAAVRTGSGKVYLGCNIENCSYGLTVCAERTAIYNAVADGATDFEALAIFTEAGELTPPCGACRQVLSEFSRDLVIILANPGEQKELKLSELLPMPFNRQSF
ncbi:MAG: cytidine deaminase [Candidatus Brocadiales bacterium]|nr:cytidine deaminase [Candidatus Bathyanammoxibius amoris]